MLVVDASPGDFESGFDLGGQTREHALLCRSLGVTQLIIAINKLDRIDWSESRVQEITIQLTRFLTSTVGFKSNYLHFIPVSGLTGENLTTRGNTFNLVSWYSGPSLLEAMDSLEVPLRSVEKSLRISISDFYKGGLGVGGSGAVTVVGRVEQGSLQLGESLVLVPSGEVGVVKSKFLFPFFFSLLLNSGARSSLVSICLTSPPPHVCHTTRLSSCFRTTYP